MKKIIFPGLLAGVAMLAINMILGMLVFDRLIPSLSQEYTNPALFRPWSDPLMSLMFLTPIITGFIMAWLWNYTKPAFGHLSGSQAGLMLGFIIWLLGLPGMVISLATFPVSFVMVLSWTISNLIQFPVGGLIIASMNKHSLKIAGA